MSIAGLHRRRLHRRHRSGQQFGARRHARRADHRRAGGALRADADAVVVALKTRSLPADEAVAQSLAALAWLRAQGAEQIYFKYCSTFDSTPQGNIGPVTDALMARLGTDFTIATPAFPDNRRTVFKGYLFVGDVLLNESGMQHHPLTPMTDPNLLRVLAAQTRRKVGLIDHAVVARGSAAIRERIAAARRGRGDRHRRCRVQRRPAGSGTGAEGHAPGDGGFGRGDWPAGELA